MEDEHYNNFVEDEHYSDALYVFKKPEYHKARLGHNGICSLKSSMLRVSAERIKHTKHWEKCSVKYIQGFSASFFQDNSKGNTLNKSI